MAGDRPQAGQRRPALRAGPDAVEPLGRGHRGAATCAPRCAAGSTPWSTPPVSTRSGRGTGSSCGCCTTRSGSSRTTPATPDPDYLTMCIAVAKAVQEVGYFAHAPTGLGRPAGDAMPRTIDTSFVDNLKPSMAEMFFDRVAKSGPNEAFRYPVGETWKSVTWKEAGDRVTNLAAGLLSLGIQPEQRVGIAAAHALRVDPRRPRGHVRRRRHHDRLPDRRTPRTRRTSSATPSARSSSSRTTSRSPSSTSAAARSPPSARSITFDGAGDGDWVITLDALADLGEKYLVEHAGAVEPRSRRSSPTSSPR